VAILPDNCHPSSFLDFLRRTARTTYVDAVYVLLPTE